MPRGNKRKAQIKHAMRRARERFGVEVSPGVLHDYVRRIQNREAKFVERQSNRITVWDLDGKRLVYDKQRKMIVTILWPKGRPE